MSDELNAFERLDADMPLPLDLRALEDRVIDDSVAWEARVPSADRLMRFARELPAAGAPQTDVPSVEGGSGARPGGAPERIRHRVAQSHAPRRHALAAYAAAFGLMALTTLLLVQLASLRGVGTSVAPKRAEATAATTGSTPASSPTISASATASVTATQASSAGASGEAADTVVGLEVHSGTVEASSNQCGATVPISPGVALYSAGAVSNGTATYRWLHSDGSVSDPIIVTYSTVNTPQGPRSAVFTSEWDVPSAGADGSEQWVAVELLAPNHLISAHASFRLTCTFTLNDVTATTHGGIPYNGGTATQYDCAAPLLFPQAFSFTAVVHVSGAPGDHVITYHWLRSDGIRDPDQTVTVPAGAISAAIPPEPWLVDSTFPNSPNANWEEVVVSSPVSLTSNAAVFFKNCA